MWLVVSLAVFALLAGCAVGGSRETPGMDDPGTSLVFGYIDMTDAPTTISGASIVQVWPPSDKPDWGANARHGLFHTYVPQGSYQLASVSGSSPAKVSYSYDIQNWDELRVHQQQGIYFLGSYRYLRTETGGFELERMDTPNEAQLLKRILDEDLAVKGSAWEGRIRERLAELESVPQREGPDVMLARRK